MKGGLAAIAAAVVALGVAASPASADQHLMKIVEVFPGTAAQPDAQYIVLQMYQGGQNLVDTHDVVIFDANDVLVGSSTFTADLPNGINQSKILIATPEAEALFGVTADLAMTPSLTLGGGSVCFGRLGGFLWFDCFTWGNFTDQAGNSYFFPPNYRPATGLTQGQAAVCDESRGVNPSSLDSSDCLNEADDYVCGDARPLANPVGSTPGFLAANPPCPVEQHIFGKSVLVTDPEPGDDPTRRKILVKAKELASPNPLIGDPIAGGATLEILLRGTTPSSQTFVLPAGAPFWRAIGSIGYRYRDSNSVNGPIKRLLVKKTATGTFLLTILGTGANSPLNLVPPNVGTEARVRLVIAGGGEPYCVSFGGDAGGPLGPNTAALFQASAPFGEGLCPP
jgi:hypothetical protein